MEQSDKKNKLLSFIQEYRLVREEDIYVLYSYEYGRSSEYVSNSGVKWKS